MMGYRPPSGLLVLPKDVTFTASEAIRQDVSAQLATLYGIYSTPRMVTRPFKASSYEQYRRDLYGERKRDWFPFFNAALLVSLIALVVAVAWALL